MSFSVLCEMHDMHADDIVCGSSKCCGFYLTMRSEAICGIRDESDTRKSIVSYLTTNSSVLTQHDNPFLNRHCLIQQKTFLLSRIKIKSRKHVLLVKKKSPVPLCSLQALLKYFSLRVWLLLLICVPLNILVNMLKILLLI